VNSSPYNKVIHATPNRVVKTKLFHREKLSREERGKKGKMFKVAKMFWSNP
jgi:hypothetical protein